MKVYYISILEQYYQNTDNLFGKDLYTKTESDQPNYQINNLIVFLVS